jgi:hypothetical protein
MADLVWCTVYSNSLLATLNARKHIRGAVGINTRGSFSFRVSPGPGTNHTPAVCITVRLLSFELVHSPRALDVSLV